MLDVGAADGILSRPLRDRAWRVTAIERDPSRAARAREFCVEVVEADLNQDLPALRGPFETIVCGDVLEHLVDPAAVLRTLAHHLAPGGRFVLSLPNVAHLWVRLGLLLGHFDYTDRGIMDRTHLHFYTRRTVIELLESAGLHVEGLEATPTPLTEIVPARYHGRWLAVVMFFQAGFARVFPTILGYQFVVVARRKQDRS